MYKLNDLLRLALEYALKEELENIKQQKTPEATKEDTAKREQVEQEHIESKKTMPQTLTIHKENISINNEWEELINITGRGTVRSLVIKTNGKDYRIYVEIDNTENSINKEFEWFIKNSSIASEWYAGEYDDGYVFVINNISFKKKLLLAIYGNITVNEVLGIIDIYGDTNE